ncbi:hypothetical protein [Pseudoalteromonas sp. T1lg48]|uniref:hypothetical protein n=1 Tax=Pseudoalteromonas sp. T1lg48 TaxID=2077100 RepID=UPI000CF66B8B|nr:hypothetical protein [Pseudoalteromonas sp. T1lg48]
MFDHQFVQNFRKVYGYQARKASKELGVHEVTIHKYLKKGNAPKPIKILLNIKARGYLPDTGGWKDCYIDPQTHELVTPWYTISAGQLCFYPRYKWSATEHKRMYDNLKRETDTQREFMQSLNEQLVKLVGDIARRTGTDD